MYRIAVLIFVVLLFSAALTSSAEAEEKISTDSLIALGWQKDLIYDLLTAQTAYSDSWVGGEQGTFTWVMNLNGRAERQFNETFNLRSLLRLSYGQTNTQDTAGNWSKPRKTTDLIDWETVGSFNLHKWVDPYVAFRIEGRFVNAQVASKKRYFTPITFTESAGGTHQFYKTKEEFITSRLGFAFRQTIENVIIDTALLTTEDSVKTDGGFESVTDVQLRLSGKGKLTYIGKLTLYKALFFSESDQVEGTPFEDDWKAIDVNWENTIQAEITDLIGVYLYTQFLYDKQITKKGRFKETLGLGLTFSLL